MTPKEIVIETTKGIIERYIDEQKAKGTDTYFLEKLDDPDKSIESCINHVMNNLVEKQIFGGEDSLMYEFIHEYYVDEVFDKVDDKWSNRLNGGGTSRAAKPTKAEIAQEYETLSNEEKNNIYLEQRKRAEEEAFKKAKVDIKEETKKAKEQAKEQAKGKGYEQTSIFDFLG